MSKGVRRKPVRDLTQFNGRIRAVSDLTSAKAAPDSREERISNSASTPSVLSEILDFQSLTSKLIPF